MPKMPDAWYVAQARAKLKGKFDKVEPGVGRTVEHGDGPAAPAEVSPGTVSSGTVPGAWVLMWCWVPDPAGGEIAEQEQTGPAGE